MEQEELDDLGSIQAKIWAAEAACCPVCKAPWTLDSVKVRQPRVGNVEPRILVCAACWNPWLDICRFNVKQSLAAESRTK